MYIYYITINAEIFGIQQLNVLPSALWIRLCVANRAHDIHIQIMSPSQTLSITLDKSPHLSMFGFPHLQKVRARLLKLWGLNNGNDSSFYNSQVCLLFFFFFIFPKSVGFPPLMARTLSTFRNLSDVACSTTEKEMP